MMDLKKTTLFNNTRIHLSKRDAIKALFGKTIHLRTQIDVTNKFEVTDTRQTIYVDRIFPKKEVGYVEMSTPDNQ